MLRKKQLHVARPCTEDKLCSAKTICNTVIHFDIKNRILNINLNTLIIILYTCSKYLVLLNVCIFMY